MDAALPPGEQAVVCEVLDRYAREGVRYHALRTRGAGARRFVSVHILVPGTWTVQRGHDVLEQIEGEMRERLSGVTVFTHLEPLEDPAALLDVSLDRAVAAPEPPGPA